MYGSVSFPMICISVASSYVMILFEWLKLHNNYF